MSREFIIVYEEERARAKEWCVGVLKVIS